MQDRDQIDRKTHVSFGMRATDLIPNEVTRLLGIEPSRSWAKGDGFLSVMGPRERSWGVWSFASAPAVESDDVAEHVKYMLNRLEPVRERILEFVKNPDYCVGVWIWWVGEDRVEGCEVKSEALERLCSLCQFVHITFLTQPIADAGYTLSEPE